MRIKDFLKNKDEKKYKCDDILIFIFNIYNCLIIFWKNYNKYILENVL